MAVGVVTHARGTKHEFGLGQLLIVTLLHRTSANAILIAAQPVLLELGRHQLVHTVAVLPPAVVDDEQLLFLRAGVLLHPVEVEALGIVLHAQG